MTARPVCAHVAEDRPRHVQARTAPPSPAAAAEAIAASVARSRRGGQVGAKLRSDAQQSRPLPCSRPRCCQPPPQGP